MANDIRYEQLLSQAKQGIVPSPEDLRDVRFQLEKEVPSADLYTLIHIVGKAKIKSLKNLLVKYTTFHQGEDSEMIRRIAIQVLGQMWDDRDAFGIAAEKAFNDPSELVRMIAATTVGHLGARYPDLASQAGHLLARGFHETLGVDQELWEAFHRGLLYLFDVPVQQHPNAANQLKPSEVRWDLLARAECLGGQR